MTKKNDFSSDSLEQKVDLLIKRFEEQKGIIDSYIERERDTTYKYIYICR